MTYLALTLAICVALCASRADSQTFQTLLAFTGTSGAAIGAGPSNSLTISGTTLYGMAELGGTNDDGNVFSVATNGTNYQNLLSFTGTGGAASGAYPAGGLTLSGTSLYGMTAEGGTNISSLGSGYGNIFSVGTGGTNYQNLVSFTGFSGPASGSYPFGSLTLSGTALYGMTGQGGANSAGTIFSLGTGGTNYQNLVTFTGSSGTAIGGLPGDSLTLSGTTLYGMTSETDTHGGYGNIFSVGTGGTNYRDLVSFTGRGGTASGAAPIGGLTLSDTTIYGMTPGGGTNGYGNIFSVGINGTNYRNLLSFTGTAGAAIGAYPHGSLTLSGTTVYGVTMAGGTDGYGNIFSVGIDGSDYQNLYSFTGGTDGGEPEGDLMLSGGTLFGTTVYGGNLSLDNGNGDGTVFALTLPAPTPEPGTLALAGAAAVAIVSYRWRRRRPRWAPEFRL